MGISTMEQLTDAMGAAGPSRRMNFLKIEDTPEGVGAIHSYWDLGDIPISRSASPGLVGVVPTRASVGAIGQANPTAGKKLYISYFGANIHTNTAQMSWVMAGDILWFNDSMSGTVTADTTLGATPSVNRLYDYAGNEAWINFFSVIGGTARTLTVKYTNLAGVTGRTATWIQPDGGQSGVAQTDYSRRLQLQAGDTGMLKPTSYSWSGTTGAVGDFGIMIVRPLARIICPAGAVGGTAGFDQLGLPRVEDDACIAFWSSMPGTNPTRIIGTIAFCEEQ